MDYSIKKRLIQDVIIHPFVKQDGTGDATYDAPVTLKSIISGRVRLVRNVIGQEVISQRTIYLEQQVHLKDLVQIDDGKFPIINLQSWFDERGQLALVEVLL